ncbi:MAG: periplasmic heavy metal sensor [Bacteroidetes bacterium]|nr:periplasmic heavy metal sensor [Bacteroidota bacterium]
MNRLFGKYTWLIGLLILLNAITLFVFWPDRKQDRGRFDPQKVLEQELGLDPEKANRFKILRQHFFEKSSPLTKELRETRQQMLSAMGNPDGNQAATALSQKSCEIQQRLDSMLLDHYLQLSALCDAEQQEKLKKMFQHVFSARHGKKKPHPRKKGLE